MHRPTKIVYISLRLKNVSLGSSDALLSLRTQPKDLNEVTKSNKLKIIFLVAINAIRNLDFQVHGTQFK